MIFTSSEPLVSIVLATYNGEKFLQAQLDSLINQTYKNIEIVAIDDFSSDNTFMILTQCVALHKNMTVVRNAVNIGYIKNFEKGFLLAKGDYIAPCDQDDIWLPTKIEVLLKNMGNNAIAYCDSEFIDSNGKSLEQKMSDIKTLTNFDSPLMYIELGTSVHGHALLAKKSVVLAAVPFPDVISYDNWLSFVATLNGSIKFVDDVLVQYRRHDSNLKNALHKKDRKRLAGNKRTKQEHITNAQQRLKAFHDKCPDNLPEKAIIKQLCQSHESYSFKNNILRMKLYFQQSNKILLHKKYRHPRLRRWLHCVKAFYKMI